MKQLLKSLKKLDYILIISAILLSFTPTVLTTFFISSQKTAQKIAVIKINGEIVDRYVLSDNTPPQEIYYTPNPDQYNIVEINGNRIRIKEDNSPDQIGVRTGWISRTGQLAICLPHQFIIEIINTEENEEPKIIIPL